MTPLDRYRKHSALFDYWNAELLDGLAPQEVNPKKVRQASAESLQELRALQGLLQDELAAGVDRLIAERTRIDRQLQGGAFNPAQADLLRRDVEAQTRQVHRELFWRDVQDRLKASPTTDANPH